MDSEAARIISEWELREPVQVARSALGSVYRVHLGEDTAVLKVFTELGVKDEGAGSVALRHFGGRGAVYLLRSTNRAQLLEYVEGENLARVPDEYATEVLCEVLRKLHAGGKTLPEGLVTLSRRFRSLLEYEGAEKLLQDGAAVARELLSSVPADSERVLHGDLHHENVLLSRDRGHLAIDPKGLRGEAMFDAVNMIYNPARDPERVLAPGRLEREVAVITEQLGYDVQRFRRWCFAYGALSAQWQHEDGQDAALSLTLATKVRASF
jgi:streptomycin 6-kinase